MEIIEKYESSTFSVEFLIGNPFRRSHKGKHWPVVTQCIIKNNGLIIGLGEVAKHMDEEHNPRYGKLKAAKKAFENGKHKIWREMRERLWKQILVETTEK